MADRKLSEFTLVNDLAGSDHLTGVDNSAAPEQKNVIITVDNFLEKTGRVTYLTDSEPAGAARELWFNDLTQSLKVHDGSGWKGLTPDGGFF